MLVVNIAENFNHCFSCCERIEETGLAWACRRCWNTGNIPKVVKDMLHCMPRHIPKGQHYRYIRRIYLGKVGHEAIK